jgi:hypothetical protein
VYYIASSNSKSDSDAAIWLRALQYSGIAFVIKFIDSILNMLQELLVLTTSLLGVQKSGMLAVTSLLKEEDFFAEVYQPM